MQSTECVWRADYDVFSADKMDDVLRSSFLR